MMKRIFTSRILYEADWDKNESKPINARVQTMSVEDLLAPSQRFILQICLESQKIS